MRKNKFKRRQYFLMNSSQPRMLVGLQVGLGVVAILATLMLYTVANRGLSEFNTPAYLAIRNMRQVLLLSLIILNITGLISSILVFIFFTHRVVGPIYQVRKKLGKVNQGDLTPIVKFRKDDYLHPLAEDLNQVLEFLALEIGEMKERVDVLSKIMDDGKSSQDILADPESYQHISIAVSEIQQRIGKFETERGS